MHRHPPEPPTVCSARRHALRRCFATAVLGACIATATVFVATRAFAVTVTVDGTAGDAGGMAEVVARLSTAVDAPVAAVQADVEFDAVHTPIAVTADGRPDCVVNPSIRKNATRFAFHPPGCVPQRGECRRVRAVVVATDNVDAIPSGVELYRCRVALTAQAKPGHYGLRVGNAMYAPPSGGDRIPEVISGMVTVMEPTVAPTIVPTPVATAGSSGGSGGGGCSIEGPAGVMWPWILIGVLAWRRRAARRRT